MDLYQTADSDAHINPDHRDVLDDAERTQTELIPHDDPQNASKPLPQQVADVHMPAEMSEIIAAEKTDDFCQTLFATMGQYKSYFF